MNDACLASIPRRAAPSALLALALLAPGAVIAGDVPAPADAFEELERRYFDGLRTSPPPAGWGPFGWVDGWPDGPTPRHRTVATPESFTQPPGERAPEDTPFVPDCFDPDDLTDLPLGLTRVDQPALLHWLEFYCTTGRRLLTGWFARAGRFRPLIEAELERQQAPRDLLWVVAIESAFEPNAVSRAGAVGLWQFMPRTARGLGMRIDRQIDERRDFDISTRHGIAYLLDNHDRFGSWPLALAAYNAGHGHVRGQLRQANSNDFWRMEDYGAIFRGARNYATRVLAIAIIDRHRDIFAFDDVIEDPPWQWDEVEVSGGVRLAAIARALGVPLEELRRLNPALRTAEVPAPLPRYTLRIPAGTTPRFVENVDQLRRRYGDTHERVTLRFGETLDHISRQTGIPERVLRHVNDLPRGVHPAYGDEVLVPLQGRRTQPESPRPPRVVLLPAGPFRTGDRVRVFHVVNPGDSARAIAEHFGVPLHQLVAWNDLDPDARLWSGMVLQIFVPADQDLSTSLVLHEEDVLALHLGSAEHEAWLAEQEQTRQIRRRTWTVQRGDTVLGLAIRFGVRSADIIRWNNLDDDASIQIGQILIVGR